MNTSALLKSKVTLIFAGLLVVVLGLNLFFAARSNSSIDQEIADLDDEIRTLEKENIELRQLVTYLNSSAFIEEQARAELGLKKKDEQAVVIPDFNPIAKLEDQSNEKRTNINSSNPKKWLYYFTQPE